jgi:hypothetical protein
MVMLFTTYNKQNEKSGEMPLCVIVMVITSVTGSTLSASRRLAWRGRLHRVCSSPQGTRLFQRSVIEIAFSTQKQVIPDGERYEDKAIPVHKHCLYTATTAVQYGRNFYFFFYTFWLSRLL